jgi:hypothetical protein
MPFLGGSVRFLTRGKALTQRGRVDDPRKTGKHQRDHWMGVGESKQRTRSDPEQGSQGDIVESVTPPIYTIAEYGSHHHLSIRPMEYIGRGHLPESQYFHSAGIQPLLQCIPSYGSVAS